MPRLLSLLMIFVIATMYLPNDRTRAQESNQTCSECKKCQTCPAAQTTNSRPFEFELPGIDFPIEVRVEVELDENTTDKSTAARDIEIHCEGCKCYPATLTGVPFMASEHGRMFTNIGRAKTSPCQSGQQDSECNETECKATECKATECKAAECKAAASKACQSCPASCTALTAQSNDTKASQKHPHGVQLVGFVESSRDENANSHPAEIREKMFELRLENERLKMEIKAAAERLKIIEEVMEMHEENAILRTRIEFYEAHAHGAKASSPIHSK